MKLFGYYCKKASFGAGSLFFFLYLLSGSGFVFSQNMQQQGMEAKEKNFTSFKQNSRALELSDWKKYNDPSDYDHPEFGVLVEDAPCASCVEVLSKRTADERYFVNTQKPSEFYQQKALGNLNMSVNGDWVTIDHTLQPSGNQIYSSGYTIEQAVIDAGNHRTYIKTPSGPVYFNNWKLISKTGDTETDHGAADWSDYSVGADGMLIRNVFPGIDAEILVFRGALKTNFILRENLLGTFDELVFRDEFSSELSTALNFSETPMLSEGTGEAGLYSGNSEILHIGESVLFARNGPKELLQTGSYRLNGNKLDVIVPFTWINENIGNYVLVVDPVVTGSATLAQASITGSQYNGSCNFTNSCNYNLAVPRPANATINNVAWTFTYSATGSCWLEDGGLRFGTGSCISPATTGYYWFCNAIGGGTCSGNNQTIFGDVSSCLPAPGCTPQNVNFTLQFFRSCYGAGGCNNTCIGAGSPWTMTITGNTIDYANVANPITLSATTVCQGGSITASTSGTGGVPGYTYNWSFSPTGTPSVGTGASTSIAFPTSGTITLYSIVTDACGNSVTSSRTITVTPGPTVSVTPSPATICAGGSTVLTASGATTYTWSPATGLSATTGASVTASPAATTVYTVTSTASGCTSTATVTVNVNPNPVITVNSETICAGASATLTASGATSYVWSPAAGLSATTGATVTANPATTTTYTITGTTAGCTGTATSTVTVNPVPVVTVNSPTICAGASATLTANGAASYIWSPATGLSATTGTTVTANPSSTTTYTVSGTTTGCSGTATATVTVNPNPVITVNSPTICAGASATLNATGAAGYVWSPATGLSATTGATVTANPSITTTYTITGTTAGCTGTATSTVTVTPLPVISISPSPANICAGGSATLTATGAASYTWSPATGLSATTGASVTASPAATTVYTVTGTSTGCSSTATVSVNVTSNPVVVVSPASATICNGSSTVLSATGATSYTWSPATGLSSTTGSPITASPSVSTLYTVTGTTGACSSTATTTITVNPTPVVNINPGAATICSGSSTTFTASGAASYSWSPSTGLSSTTAATVTATPATTTTYTVTGTTSGCTETASIVITVNPTPVVAVNSGSYCAGGSLQLNATGAASYSWSPATGLSSTTGSPVTASPGATTTYTITGTTNGCSSTAASTVTVNANPTVTVNSPTICAGSTATLVAGGTSTGYSWSPSTGLSSTTGSPVISSVTTTTSYVVTGTNAAGCTSTAASTVTVNPLPAISASNNGPLCPGDTLYLTAVSGAGVTYSWSGPVSFSSTQQNPSIPSISSANAGAYTVTATINSCSSSATTTLAMNPGISTAITPAGPFCRDDAAVNLIAASPGGIWAGAGITDPNTGAFNPAAANYGPNTITYEIPGGCSDISSAAIVVNPLPSVSFSADETAGCAPLTVNFTNNSPSTGAIVWNFDGTTEPGTGQTADFTFTNEDCFTISLTMTDVNGCDATSQVVDMVCVSPAPQADFSVNSEEADVFYPVFEFINHSADATNYSWDFGDGTVSSSTSPQHIYDEVAGSYLVWLYASNTAGCIDSMSKIVTVKEDILFYAPNAFTPNGDEHNNTFQPVFTTGFDQQSFNLTIYNRWGEVVFETKDASKGWDGTYNETLAPEGSYAWTVQFRAQNTDEKFRYSGAFVLLK